MGVQQSSMVSQQSSHVPPASALNHKRLFTTRASFTENDLINPKPRELQEDYGRTQYQNLTRMTVPPQVPQSKPFIPPTTHTYQSPPLMAYQHPGEKQQQLSIPSSHVKPPLTTNQYLTSVQRETALRKMRQRQNATGVQFDLNDWDRTQVLSSTVIGYKHRETHQLMEAHLIPNNDAPNLLSLRYLHPSLAASYLPYPRENKNNTKTEWLYLEALPVRLSMFTDVPYPDVLHLYQQALAGFGQLMLNIGPFEVREEMIGVNVGCVVKVWCDTRVDGNGELRRKCKQSQMVESILDLIVGNTDMSAMPTPTVDEHLRSTCKKPYTFLALLSSLHHYVSKKNSGRIPPLLQKIKASGGISTLLKQFQLISGKTHQNNQRLWQPGNQSVQFPCVPLMEQEYDVNHKVNNGYRSNNVQAINVNGKTKMQDNQFNATPFPKSVKFQQPRQNSEMSSVVSPYPLTQSVYVPPTHNRVSPIAQRALPPPRVYYRIHTPSVSPTASKRLSPRSSVSPKLSPKLSQSQVYLNHAPSVRINVTPPKRSVINTRPITPPKIITPMKLNLQENTPKPHSPTLPSVTHRHSPGQWRVKEVIPSGSPGLGVIIKRLSPHKPATQSNKIQIPIQKKYQTPVSFNYTLFAKDPHQPMKKSDLQTQSARITPIFPQKQSSFALKEIPEKASEQRVKNSLSSSHSSGGNRRNESWAQLRDVIKENQMQIQESERLLLRKNINNPNALYDAKVATSREISPEQNQHLMTSQAAKQQQIFTSLEFMSELQKLNQKYSSALTPR